MSLEGLLTHREPLGPIDQAHIRDQDSDTIINPSVAPFSEALIRAPILLLGRKGSGKSAILAAHRLRSLHWVDRAASLESPPESGAPFLISIGSWDHFHQLTRHVASQFRANNYPDLDSEMVPAEYLSKLWQEAIWHEIIMYFYNFCHHRESRPSLLGVEQYVLADGRFSGSAERAARELFTAAKAAVLKFAASRKSEILLLIDSMERYPVRNTIFSEVLSGLLQAVNAVHYDSDLVHVTFCLPEEIEAHLLSDSANIMKDYNAAYRIRWKPIDLLKVAAHRFRLFAKLRDPKFYKQVEGADLDARDGIHDFFRAIFPASINNAMHEPEDPLAYIIRHTQLLPRHVIAIFNGIISRSYERTSQFARLDECAIRDGIADAEKLIAQHVLVPYYKIYPGLISACEDILPDLSPICTFNDLRKIERRFHQRVEDDVRNIWRTLFAMGVIGKIVDSVSQETSECNRGSRYYFAQFHFNVEGSFGLSGNTNYCFHPIFTRHFGISRRDSDDRRAIYPANIEVLTIG